MSAFACSSMRGPQAAVAVGISLDLHYHVCAISPTEETLTLPFFQGEGI
jgi:hypothetical protein